MKQWVYRVFSGIITNCIHFSPFGPSPPGHDLEPPISKICLLAVLMGCGLILNAFPLGSTWAFLRKGSTSLPRGLLWNYFLLINIVRQWRQAGLQLNVALYFVINSVWHLQIFPMLPHYFLLQRFLSFQTPAVLSVLSDSWTHKPVRKAPVKSSLLTKEIPQ